MWPIDAGSVISRGSVAGTHLSRKTAGRLMSFVDHKLKSHPYRLSMATGTLPQEERTSQTTEGRFDYFQVVVAGDGTDMLVRLPKGRDHTFADLRREIEEDAAGDGERPFGSNFRFTIDQAKGMSVYRKQEEKWRVRDYDLQDKGDGSFKSPYRVYIKEVQTGERGEGFISCMEEGSGPFLGLLSALAGDASRAK